MNNIIVVIVVSLLMSYLYKASKNNPKCDTDGSIVLKMNNFYGIVGWVTVSISIVIGCLLIMNVGNVQKSEGLTSIIAIMGMFFIFAILLILASRIRVTVTEEQIIYSGVLGNVKVIEWINIDEVSFNSAALELTLKHNKTKIKLHMHLIGIYDFIKMMETKLEPSLYENAVNKISNMNNI